MDKIQEDLFELCIHFLRLLEMLKEKGLISDSEYEILGRQKDCLSTKNKLSS